MIFTNNRTVCVCVCVCVSLVLIRQARKHNSMRPHDPYRISQKAFPDSMRGRMTLLVSGDFLATLVGEFALHDLCSNF